jgi:phosphatidylglycerophosphate synthase
MIRRTEKIAPGADVTIPNFITLGRVILVPVIFYLLISNQTKAAFVVFVIAGVSDGIDGFLAKPISIRWPTSCCWSACSLR